MKKNISMMGKVGLGLMVGGLVVGSGTAAATEFTASAIIQNTLAVTKIQDMNFGTLFAAGANSSAVSSLELSPAGVIASITALDIGGGDPDNDAPAFLDLGGEAAARATVSSNNTEFTLSLPEGVRADLYESTTWTPTNGIELKVNEDTTEPRFYLTDFVAGDSPNAGIAGAAGSGTFTVTPDFAVDVVEFGIGATISTDGAGGVGTKKSKYQQQTYSGSFQVTASF